MVVRDLEIECRGSGLVLQQCSEHHYQIVDPADGCQLVDVWPGTNKFRWCGANTLAKAKSGSARAAVKEAIHCRKVNAEKARAFEQASGDKAAGGQAAGAPAGSIPFDYTEWRNNAPRNAEAEAVIQEMRQQSRRTVLNNLRHIMQLAAARLRHHGSGLDNAIAQEIEWFTEEVQETAPH